MKFPLKKMVHFQGANSFIFGKSKSGKFGEQQSWRSWNDRIEMLSTKRRPGTGPNQLEVLYGSGGLGLSHPLSLQSFNFKLNIYVNWKWSSHPKTEKERVIVPILLWSSRFGQMFDISTDFMWGKPWPSLRIEFTGKSLAFGYTVRVVVTCNRETEKSVESRMIHTYVCDNIYILYISINESMSIYIFT